MKKSNLAEKLHNFNEIENEDNINSRIYSTMEYSKFKFIEGNRKIDSNNLNRLIEAMQIKDFKIPILVNNKFEVIDGQHRLTARKKLLLPVYYMIENMEGNADSIILATMAQKPLTLYSIARLRADTGNVEYQNLMEYCKEYDFSINLGIMLTSKNSRKYKQGKDAHQFKLGKYKCDNLLFAQTIGDFIKALYKETNSSIVKQTFFIHSLLAVMNMDKFDSEHLLEQVKKYKHLLEQKATRKQYQDMIHEIYNYKSRCKLNLRPI